MRDGAPAGYAAGRLAVALALLLVVVAAVAALVLTGAAEALLDAAQRMITNARDSAPKLAVAQGTWVLWYQGLTWHN